MNEILNNVNYRRFPELSTSIFRQRIWVTIIHDAGSNGMADTPSLIMHYASSHILLEKSAK
jgi:hypothetical protein